MDQDLSSNPVTQAPTVPVSSDGSVSDPTTAFSPLASDAVVVPGSLSDPTDTAPIPDIQSEVAKKIAEAKNVLVALSGDPSVDEMSAAIGLTLFLDKLGKRTTAIYSGSTPNALEFLKPEETFESSADTLQDFVIALNKDKADHLRYKLDGDYVKIYITPYKTRISEEDLEFSYGDYNVDLVLALDVSNGIDLDAALREHGRIMHDAVIVNITTSNPGHFGEIEWSDKSASSVSEMVAKLIYSANSKTEIGKEEATAFLTGIVAATNRFSNAKTTPETMEISSRLMQSGANQQLISKNITPDIDNELYSLLGDNASKRDADPTKLDIEHDRKEDTDKVSDANTNESKEKDSSSAEETSALLDDLKAAETSLAATGNETIPDTSDQPVKLDDTITDADTTELNSNPYPSPEPAPEPSGSTSLTEPVLPPVMSSFDSTAKGDTSTEPTPESDLNKEETTGDNNRPEKIIQPLPGMDLSSPNDGSDKYGKMLEDAISGLDGGPMPAATNPADNNPAFAMTPQVASTPEVNGVPEMNYMPMPGEEVLPPPPTPPIDMSTTAPETSPASTESITTDAPAEPAEPIQPAAPPVEPAPTSLGPQPAMQDQIYSPQVSNPGTFKIPGM